MSADGIKGAEHAQQRNALRLLIDDVNQLAAGWDDTGRFLEIKQTASNAERALASDDSARINAAGKEMYELKADLQSTLNK